MTDKPAEEGYKQKLIILRAPALGATRDPNAGVGAIPAEAAAAEAAANVKVEFDERVSRGTVRAIINDPTVLGFAPAMPMKLVEPLESPPGVVPEAGQTTWGVAAVGAPTSPFTGDGVTVAVLDTGIDATHPAFTGVNLIQKDFTGA